jgi:2-polyprenyl-6-hydroxyphenyl methylase / 3-demethylubiquinone-9 3-methyltransferase
MTATEDREHVNNTYFDALADRWYEAWDDPIALLRQETEAKLTWAIPSILRNGASTVLDIGCGAGFVSNGLAKHGFQVTGVDYSQDSLDVAQRHAPSKNPPRYEWGDAYALPFADDAFDSVIAFDFLEHVTRPQKIIAEVKRVLRPGGVFLFHTFNRNPLAYLIVIKGVEWFVKNTPPKLHTLDLFIRPAELSQMLCKTGFSKPEFCGIRPVFNRGFWELLKTGVVSPAVQFTTTASTLLSYCGSSRLLP